MAWTTPRDWTTGELEDAATFNTHVRDNFLAVMHPLTQTGATLDIASTAAETSLGSFTVPGNSMGANGKLQVVYEGDMLFNNNIGNTMNLRIYFPSAGLPTPGTPLVAGAITPSLGGLLTTRMFWKLEIEMTNLNATGSQFLLAQISRPRVGGSGGQTSLATWIQNEPWMGHALPAVDTTADRIFEVTAQWSASSANNSWRRYLMHAQVAKV
jgi:hypothetical protein